MRIYLFLFLLCISSQMGFSQQRMEAEFGKISEQEISMTSYEKDPDANAVVLFEKAKNYVKLVNNSIKFVREVHKRIKVFDPEKFDGKTLKIYYRTPRNNKEEIYKIKAVTHNGNLQNFVAENSFYRNKENENYSSLSFTFPNVKEGSIIEFQYTLYSNNAYSFNGWEFQDEIPKVYTEYHSEIPGNYRYNKVLVGNLPLYINEVSLLEGCFFIEGYAQNADCEVAIYAMKNVPAFKEEDYMLTSKNFKSSIKLELREYTSFDGHPYKVSEDWSDVDNEVRTDKNLGRELKNNSFFRDKVPMEGDQPTLQNAKRIFYFIQNHFTWNGWYGLFGDKDCKKAFEEKSGSIAEINFALINALQAHDFEANLVLSSSRDHGLPTVKYPVLSEFNYALCHLNINGKQYLLDASNKFTEFGMLPFHSLNKIARVMDYKNESFWVSVTPNPKNISYLRTKLSITDENLFTGTVQETNIGYYALNARERIHEDGQEKYLEKKKERMKNVTLAKYQVEDLTSLEKPVKETYEVTLTPESINNNIYFSPFDLQRFFKKNPFTLNQRTYPVEFGYPFVINYAFALDLGTQYEVVNLPSNVHAELPDGLGDFQVKYMKNATELIVTFTIKVQKDSIDPNYYEALKNFFKDIALAQSKELIQLKKV